MDEKHRNILVKIQGETIVSALSYLRRGMTTAAKDCLESARETALRFGSPASQLPCEQCESVPALPGDVLCRDCARVEGR